VKEKRCKQGFVGKPEKRALLGTLRRRCENNIKMEVREVEWGHGLDRSFVGLL
jgi:hypothetical protein